MKKIVWFVKLDDKNVEVKLQDIIAMTSNNKALKITEYNVNNETHKVVEFYK
jgi:hypothetical protein